MPDVFLKRKKHFLLKSNFKQTSFTLLCWTESSLTNEHLLLPKSKTVIVTATGFEPTTT